MTILLIPIVEEIIFRLPLLYTRSNMVICSLFTLMTIGSFPIYIGLTLFIVILGLLSPFMWTTAPEALDKKYKYVYQKFQKQIAMVLIIGFGLVHLMNFSEMDIKGYFIFPLLISAQLLLSFFASYIRLRNGFFWAIALHSVYNGILLFLLYF